MARHIELKYLLLQHLIENGLVKGFKIPGLSNISGIFTKCVSHDVLQRHITSVGLPHAQHRFLANTQHGQEEKNIKKKKNKFSHMFILMF